MNAEQLVQDVIDGVESPLKAYAVLKSEIQRLTKCLKEIEDYAIEIANRYDEKQFQAEGYQFEIRRGGAIYDYSTIPQWKEMKEKMNEIEQQAKSAYDAYRKGLITASQDGEVVPLPQVKYRKDSLIVKPIKNQ